MRDLFETVVGPDGSEPELLARHLGFEGTLPMVWAVGGGVLFGGFGVALMTLAGRLSGQGLFVTAAVLFLMGSAFGFIHGGVLAFFARDRARPRTAFFEALGRSVLFSVPVLAVGWAVAGWIALTDAAVYLGRPLPLFGVGVGWLLGIAVLMVAVAFGTRGFGRALARWPDARVGTFLVALGFAALIVTFYLDRPDLWWSGRPMGMPGPVILAGGVTVWLIGPAVTLGLTALRRLPEGSPTLLAGTFGRALPAAVVGFLAGAALGVAAKAVVGAYGILPLALWSGTVGELCLIASAQAVLDETILRLLAVSGLLWLGYRWTGRHRGAVVVAAVMVAALLHLLVYLPGVLAIGFPTAGAAAVYGIAAIFAPALVFGVIFWWGGFPAAVLAHAATVAVAALLL